MTSPTNTSSPPSKTPPSNSFSDIFSDSPPASPSTTQPPTDPSDIPRLRSIHVTNGYRDGIASAKDQALQPGFDEAYPLGAVLGLRAGYILGVLEGLCGAHGLRESQAGRGQPAEATEQKGQPLEDERQRLGELLLRAREELRIEALFGKKYWQSDGMWAYEVRTREGQGAKEDDVTFWDVADQHPVVRKWIGIVRDEVRKAGIQNAEEGFSGVGHAGIGSGAGDIRDNLAVKKEG
ncbi:MAG: hypothetical protein Q9220_001953 [cf. Caloplaca sp. 1 TL-2023]